MAHYLPPVRGYQEYMYVVKAQNDYGFGEYSLPVAVRSLTRNMLPTAPSASDIGMYLLTSPSPKPLLDLYPCTRA